MHILVVDDSRAMRMMVKKTLRDAGFGGHDIVEAGDGAEALEMIRADCPDIILCDWNMPKMNGLELLNALRGEGNETTFGFITTEGTTDAVALATEAGAGFIITKPFNAASFSKALDAVIH